MRLSHRIYLSFLALASTLPLSAQRKATAPKQDNKYSYMQAIDVLGSSMALLDRYFVDSVDLKKLSRLGLTSMLESLDPYTEYYSAEDNDKLRLMTTGEYGGIGSIISQRPDSVIIINSPMEGMPAAKAGLRAGDIILEVDGKDFRRSTSEQVSAALKGAAGSKISILIQRPGTAKPQLFSFKREQVQVNPVAYYGLVDGDYGYIALTSFTSSAAEEVKQALTTLKSRKPLKGLVLDLRGNGGGLIDEAIKIVNFFVPSGQTVVTTRGRSGTRQETHYRTTTKPLDTELPLVVLIDGASASASEIVSGALQDMDRAVVLGTKSFGKGLVQTTMQLPYEGTIKLTTAKYYIPSGRCIQRINYRSVREGKGEQVVPDSLTQVFHTRAGREVRDAGGILPDIKVTTDSLPTMLLYLNYSNDAYDWVTHYTQRHKSIASPLAFKLSDEDYADFTRHMIDKKFDYDRQSSKELTKLENLAKFEGYYERSKAEFERLKSLLVPDLKHDLEYNKAAILRQLTSSILTRYYYDRGARERSVSEDKVVHEATKLLSDSKRYRQILSSPMKP